jgi:hypothetical protein
MHKILYISYKVALGGKDMRPLIGTAVLLVLLISPSGISQLRNNSEYLQDRINTDKTYFVLHDTGAAEFGWASEWTNASADLYSDKSAMFLWHFKDGSKSYSLQEQEIGEIGKNSGFLRTSKSTSLEDIRRKSIQPLTRDNYPVKVELWIGKVEESTGFSPETFGAAVCLNAPAIEYNRTYRFSSCDPENK